MYTTDASNFVAGVDLAFWIILGISGFLLIAITAVMLYFVYRYHQKRSPVATEIHGSNKLEVIWTIIPTLLALLMFYYGWKGYYPYKNPPKNAMEITTYARMWSFNFQYPNGKESKILYVPVQQPVKLNLMAMDVLHSVFIPAFRIKSDAIPGKKSEAWFVSGKPGTYDMFCTEYCGLKHSYMYAEVKVLPEKEFLKWYNDTTGGVTASLKGGKSRPGFAGARLIESKGCTACHSSDGAKIVGPTFKGIYGEKVTVTTDGNDRTITVDDEYIKRSILNPTADVVKGYKSGQMQSYKGQLSEKQIKDIIEYIKTLNEK